MLTPMLRVLVLGFAVLLSLGGFLMKIPLTSLAGAVLVLLVLLDHYRNASVFLAARAAERNQPERAKRFLGYTSRPEWLSSANRAMYHLLRGQLAQQDNRLDDARTEYTLALNHRLGSEHNQAVVHLNLARLALEDRDADLADEHLRAARQLRFDHTLHPSLDRLQQHLNLLRHQEGTHQEV